MELGSVVIHSDYEFVSGLLYTALSCVRNPENAQLLDYDVMHLRIRSKEIEAIKNIPSVPPSENRVCCKYEVLYNVTDNSINMDKQDSNHERIETVEDIETDGTEVEIPEEFDELEVEPNLEDYLSALEECPNELSIPFVNINQFLERLVDILELSEGKFSEMKNDAIEFLQSSSKKGNTSKAHLLEGFCNHKKRNEAIHINIERGLEKNNNAGLSF